MEKPYSGETPIPTDELESQLRDISKNELPYTIALFDILGFSNYIYNDKIENVLQLYETLKKAIYEMQSIPEGENRITGVVPVPITDDWKENMLIAQANGYVNVTHFSDTFVLYVNYEIHAPSFWLRDTFHESHPLLLQEPGAECSPSFYQNINIMHSFLNTCMDFFCEAIIAGIPIRGCISSGRAIMDCYNQNFIGKALVEAARGEPSRKALNISYGKSFNNYHPVYHHFFIPYKSDLKNSSDSWVCPMVVDWPRYWRANERFSNIDFYQCIAKMNTDPSFSDYYENTVQFWEFSRNHSDWADEIQSDEMTTINEYYKAIDEWLDKVSPIK